MKTDPTKEACKRCKTPFLPKTKWQDFCSSRCRLLAYWSKEIEKDGYRIIKLEE